MSVEQAKAFIEKMKTDEAFREKIMTIKSLKDRLSAIHAAGYDCAAEEINESNAANPSAVESAVGGWTGGTGW
ncbi:Nif11-like leader peptide family natural product precursor [Chlorobium phaeovibrioides]|uniref:Nif11-like leader peptide family natural product n=1 Tax=Chlorobium phaeovibrioides TaxID=1094 RepID=A0A5M8IDN6_CHLPH|nr:Nif11-like leader peptide family natural product precursor [Chlorobium phaeovibrioides]KAA6232572.1 Nif11-like leader peptide family natural product precursor [Chlorobium phaeovibrioides]